MDLVLLMVNEKATAQTNSSIEIRRVVSPEEAQQCALMMSSSEPWLTLHRDYRQSVETLTAPGKEIYLALSDGGILGFVLLNMQGAFVGYIQSICVAPGIRGRGIGTRLMNFAEERILLEAPNVFVCVSDFNPDARRLYERLGYEFVGELKDYIIRGQSEILFRKTIAPLSEFVLSH